MSPLILRAGSRIEHESGPFHIWRSYPGEHVPNSTDTGLAALGCVDHAALSPGLLVPMHTHRDDEIFSYIREGSLTHTGSLGESLVLDARHPLMMNAGRGLAHEEHIPGDASGVRMLQIFVRPTSSGLPPRLQYKELETAESINQWRLLAGPESCPAPYHFRNAVHLYDTTLQQNSIALPPAGPDDLRWLYVFRGEVTLEAATLSEGDAVVFSSAEEVDIQTETSAQLVCFCCDSKAVYTRNGSLSG